MDTPPPSTGTRLLRLLSVVKSPAPSQYAHALKEQRIRRINAWTPAELHILRALVEHAIGKHLSYQTLLQGKYTSDQYATHAAVGNQKKHLDYPAWRKVFFRHAVDKRLRLRRRALVRLFPGLEHVQRPAFRRLFRLFDSNASGRIEFSELCEHLYRCQPGIPDTNVAFVFEWFKARDGAFMTATGLELLLQTVSELSSPASGHVHVPSADVLVQDVLQGQLAVSFEEFRDRFQHPELVEVLLAPFDIVSPVLHEYTLLDEYKQLQWKPQDVVFVVSKQWWAKWVDYIQFKYAPKAKDSVVSATDSTPGTEPVRRRNARRPGPVDNRILCEDEHLVTLKPGIAAGVDYVLLSWPIWQKLIKIYGGGPEFPRRVVDVRDSADSNPAMSDSSDSAVSAQVVDVDLYPLALHIRVAKHDSTRVNLLLARKFFLAPTTTMAELIARFGIVLGENAQDLSLWIRHSRFDPWTRLECSLDAPNLSMEYLQVKSSDELLIDFVPTDLLGEEEDESSSYSDDTDEGSHSHNNNPRGPRRRKDGSFDVAVYRPVGNDFVCSERGLEMFFKSGSWNPLADELIQQKEATSEPSALTYSGMGMMAPNNGGMMLDFNKHMNNAFRYKSRLIKHSGIRGTGLVNMGNTCFMNCALQCIGHSPIFREYFLSRRYENDINKKNVLGTSGRIATAYARLMESMWNEREVAYMVPSDFKDEFTLFRRHFQEARQHDAHEFIVSLLDSLHEDLNRKHTAHIETYGLLHDEFGAHAESDDVGSSSSSSDTAVLSLNSDDAIGSLSWEAYSKNNASIVVDLFHGQLRNESVCGSCGDRKASFDPYLFFSVPIPEVKYVRVELKIVFQVRFQADGQVLPQPVIRTAFWMQRSKKTGDLLEQIGTAHKLHPKQLIIVATRRNRIKRVVSVEESLENLMSMGDLYVYERAWTLQEVPRISPVLNCCAVGAPKVPAPVDKFAELQVGARVEVVSSTGDCRTGTVVNISESDDPAATKDDDQTGRRVCVHFDSLSNKSDKWFGESDWNEKRLQPLEAEKTEPAEVFEVQVVHRLVTSYEAEHTAKPLFKTYADAMNERPKSPQASSTDKFGFEVFGTPLFVTVASDKSCRDLHHSIMLQASRFMHKFDPSKLSCAHAHDDSDANSNQEQTPDECVKEWMKNSPFKVRVVELEDVGYALGEDLPFDSGSILQHFATRSVVVLDWNDYYSYADKDKVVSDFPAPEMAEDEQNASHSIPLESCMDELLKSETLSLDDQWMCERCGTFREGTRRSDVWKLPDLVMIQLKRFQYYENQHRQKVRSFVDFPLRGLDFSKWMGINQHANMRNQATNGSDGEGIESTNIKAMKDSQEYVYDLYAVANHVGGLARGHYTAFCRYDRDFEESAHVFTGETDGEVHCNDIWFRFDDERVVEVAERDVVSEGAYVLFYKRRKFSAHNVVQYTL
ncbi:TPA: hypothetical protein N0F65_003559 [Lagenidium giganteum]|uniref:Ubiquitinyl hydrolase 1 n=1 Tax=Lagenidium giganteum TaxID=4803 RepID=A0AAV2Z496_9STRA|nr:TPA: hypothetical protein N0F65_003559 [Lagenidium giganteum]